LGRRFRREVQLKRLEQFLEQIQRSRVKHWEIIADNRSKSGWSWGCVSGNQLSFRACRNCPAIITNDAEALP
jgi:hypothetical protein